MGKRLFPAAQVHNTLKRLVESGAISGSKADAWKKAMAEEAEVAAFRVKAEGGNAGAMLELGFSYRDGTRGLKEDLTQGFMWLKRAADLKDVYALAECGMWMCLPEWRGRQAQRESRAHHDGCGGRDGVGAEYACGILGQVNAEGCFGFDKDPQEATRWYREMQKCAFRTSPETTRERAAAWLLEHP